MAAERDIEVRLSNARKRGALEQSYKKAEGIVNLLLGINEARPEIRLEPLEGLEARYIRKTKTIVLNSDQLTSWRGRKKEIDDTLAHELVHHAQMMSNLYSNTGYFEKAYMSIDSKIKALDMGMDSKNIKKSHKIANKLQAAVGIEEIMHIDRGFKERVVNESLAYFIGAYAFSNAGSMHKTRSAIFDKLFNIDELAHMKRRNNIAKFYLETISKFAKPAEECDKVESLRGLIRIGFVEERGKLAKKIAVVAFAENNFSVLRTAQFLFRPWEDVLRSMMRIAKNYRQGANTLRIIDDIWAAELGYGNKPNSVQKLIRGAIENRHEDVKNQEI